jgi:processive 1,2-diacylglycerol beta-glucosyltransferase
MPQESLTWKFFRNGAASEKIEDAGDFARVLGRWLKEPATYAAGRENFLRLRYEEDPTTVIDELVALGNEVARAELRRQPFPPLEPGTS